MYELQHFLSKCTNTSPGLDGIPNILLINLPQEALNYMLLLFNCIWTQPISNQIDKYHSDSHPETGKDPMDPNSYRPIAFTNSMCKLLEKIINCRLRWFLESNQLICNYQGGFRVPLKLWSSKIKSYIRFIPNIHLLIHPRTNCT